MAPKKPEYREYRVGKYLIDKRTRERFVIVKREHKQRSVFITVVDNSTTVKLIGTYNNGRWREVRGTWRTAKELRKHYILLGATAQVLYG